MDVKVKGQGHITDYWFLHNVIANKVISTVNGQEMTQGECGDELGECGDDDGEDS